MPSSHLESAGLELSVVKQISEASDLDVIHHYEDGYHTVEVTFSRR